MGSRLFFNPYMYAKMTALGTVQWVARLTSAASNDNAFGVATDSQGGVYVTGQFTGTSSMTAWNADQTSFATILSTLTAGLQPYLVKYSSLGVVQWVTKGYAGSNNVSNSVTCDSTDNIYIAGYYGSILTFYNADQTAFATTLAIGTNSDAFLAKYSSSGSVLWVTRMTSAGNSDIAYGVSTDSQGNVYVTGQHNGVLTAWNANQTSFATTLSTSGTDGFLIKYNSSGSVQWVARITAASGGKTSYSVNCDLSDNVYICGQYNATATAYNANNTAFTTTLVFTGGQDGYLLKYSSTGSVLWVTRVTSTGTDTAFSVTTDSQDNVYISGQYGATLTAWNANQTSFATTLAFASITYDSFLIKLNSTGSVQWVARQSSASAANDIGYSVTSDAADNVYVTGQYGAAFTVYNADQSSFATTLSSTANDCFVVKYSSAGLVQWVAKISGTGNEVGRSINVDSTGSVYICGNYTTATTAYNANGTAFATTLGITTSTDCFLVKYS